MPFFNLILFHMHTTKQFSKNSHASMNIPKVAQRLKQSATLSGLIAYYRKEIVASC